MTDTGTNKHLGSIGTYATYAYDEHMCIAQALHLILAKQDLCTVAPMLFHFLLSV